MEQKRGEGKQRFLKRGGGGGQRGLRGGWPKKGGGGAGTPLRTMETASTN